MRFKNAVLRSDLKMQEGLNLKYRHINTIILI